MDNSKGARRKQRNIGISLYKAFGSLKQVLPMLLGIVLLLGLFQTFITREMILSVFEEKMLHDTIIGSIIGSVSAGNPITSYIM